MPDDARPRKEQNISSLRLCTKSVSLMWSEGVAQKTDERLGVAVPEPEADRGAPQPAWRSGSDRPKIQLLERNNNAESVR